MNKHAGTKTKNLDKLIAKYLEMSYYAPCSNPEFAEKSNIPHTLSVPARKVLAFDNFVASLPEHPIYRKYIVSQMGFSDDSLENIYAMQEAMQTNFVQKYPDIMFSIYDTNNPLVVKRTSYINPNSKLHSDIQKKEKPELDSGFLFFDSGRLISRAFFSNFRLKEVIHSMELSWVEAWDKEAHGLPNITTE